MELKDMIAVNEVESFKQLFGLGLFDGWLIRVTKDGVQIQSEFIAKLYNLYKMYNIKQLVYLCEAGVSFNPVLDEYEEICDQLEDRCNKFLMKLQEVKGKCIFDSSEELQITTYGIMDVKFMLAKIRAYSGELCYDCKYNLMKGIADEILKLVSYDNHRLYRIAAQCMLCAEEYEMAKTLLSLFYAKYNNISDLEDMSFANMCMLTENDVSYTPDYIVDSMYNIVDNMCSCQCKLVVGNVLMEKEEYAEAIKKFQHALKLWEVENRFSMHNFVIKYTILENMECCYDMLEDSENLDKTYEERRKFLEDVKNHTGDTYNVGVNIGLSSDCVVGLVNNFIDDFYEHPVDVE